MIQVVAPGMRTGAVTAPSSKSYAHRYYIGLSLSKSDYHIFSDVDSDDVLATTECLNELKDHSAVAHLNCGESGSTLRFLLPITTALGRKAIFSMQGRLSTRPIDELIQVLNEHGAKIEKTAYSLSCSGQIKPGIYRIPGNISSQYITGLLFALPLLSGSSTLSIEGDVASSEYIAMTEEVLKLFSIAFTKEGNLYHIPGNQTYKEPQEISIEKDWSGAAFFLCLGALSKKGVSVQRLKFSTKQGDRKILEILAGFGAKICMEGNTISVQKGTLTAQTIDASDIPDLIPAISVVAAVSKGTTYIKNASRLRLKESDRLSAIQKMINSLGGQVQETDDGLAITGVSSLSGKEVSVTKDHRIVMAAAIAATLCKEPVSIPEAECVKKSYPAFWQDFNSLEVIE